MFFIKNVHNQYFAKSLNQVLVKFVSSQDDILQDVTIFKNEDDAKNLIKYLEKHCYYKGLVVVNKIEF